jgi:hypothetical protein
VITLPSAATHVSDIRCIMRGRPLVVQSHHRNAGPMGVAKDRYDCIGVRLTVTRLAFVEV